MHASAVEMGLLSTVATMPNLLFGIVAGVCADDEGATAHPSAAAMRRALLLSIPLAALTSFFPTSRNPV